MRASRPMRCCVIRVCVDAGDSPALNRSEIRGRAARGHIAIHIGILIFFFLAVLVAISPSARAQERRSSTADAELSKASREAAHEDEQAQFKHSASVQMVAKLTGLGLDQAYWLCVGLNFAVIAGALIYFSQKNLPGIFRNRTTSIQKAMQEAKRASEDANRRLAEIETRLSRLDTEIAGMRATAEKEAVAEEARIQAAAEEDARKIVESAGQEIAAAAKLARRELTAYAANLAVSLAAKQIKVDTATDQALVRNFSQELSAKNPNGGDPKSGREGH
jgi:F-type H+-transporting ATPase subunit b